MGYIGLPTAAILASREVDVVGVDIDQHAVDTINRGEIHIVEPDLDTIVHAVIMSGKLRATAIPENADAFLIAVPTPFMKGNKPDISYVESAIRSIAPVLQKGCLVVLESTSPVGTTELMSRWLAETRSDLTFPHQNGENADVQIAYCPERVLPGHILKEITQNNRVIGGLTQYCAQRAESFYKIFVDGECVITDSKTAEMCKLTENVFRDVNIAFANELSIICDKLKINVWELIDLSNRHPRVNILQPGPGVGGHCIAVDPWFIINSAPQEAKLIRVARETNDAKPLYLIDQILKLTNSVNNPSIAFFGFTYKPNIDDVRESPSLEIVKTVTKRLPCVEILVVEPYVKELNLQLRVASNARLVGVEEALDKANILVLLVDHDMFYDIPADRLAGKQIIDSRGCWTQMLGKLGKADL